MTHVVYTAVFELPGLVPGWSERVQMDTNLEMLRNLMDPLAAAATGLQHVSLLQGTKAYGVHLHPIAIPARERFPRDQHDNFYWLQEDYIRAKSAAEGWAFSIWRPQLIVGPNHGVVMNLPPIIGAFAAICREEGRPFGFPGGASWVWECVDTRLVADALAWGATSPNAVGETFNLTNGEVFEWRTLWPSFAETFGLEPAPDEPVSLASCCPRRPTCGTASSPSTACARSRWPTSSASRTTTPTSASPSAPPRRRRRRSSARSRSSRPASAASGTPRSRSATGTRTSSTARSCRGP